MWHGLTLAILENAQPQQLMAISGLCTGTSQSSKRMYLQLWNSGCAMDAKGHDRSAISTKWIFQQSCHLRVSSDAVVPSLSYMLFASSLPLLPVLLLSCSLPFRSDLLESSITQPLLVAKWTCYKHCARAPQISQNPSKLLTCLSSSRLDRGQKQLQNSKQ